MKKVVFLLLISVFLITGCSIKRTEEVTDAEIFASEYAISKDNVFKYATIDEVIELLSNGTGIVFFGNSDQDSSLNIVKLFSYLVKEKGIKEIYYYNPTVIRDDETEEYDTLINLLEDNLTITEDGNTYLAIPSVYFVKDGKIVGYNDEAIGITQVSEEELDDFKKHLKKKYLELFNEYKQEKNID